MLRHNRRRPAIEPTVVRNRLSHVRRFAGIASLFLVCVILPLTANAGVIVEIQDTSLAPGATGYVDVLLKAETDETIDLVNYTFRIDPEGAPSGSLEFVNPQSFTELDRLDYLFFGDSLGLLLTVDPLNPFVVEGSDLTGSGNGVLLAAGESRLLVRLLVHHLGGPGGPDSGDQFRISLVDSPATWFQDPFGNDISTDRRSFDSALVQTAAAAVPEPGSASVLMMAALGYVLRRRGQNRSDSQRKIGSC